MPQRRIDPDKIESVKASYNDMSTVLADSVDFIGEGDNSREKLAVTTAKVKALSQMITSTVDSMDTYLNSVAEAFRQTDAQVADDIASYRISDSQRKQDRIMKQQNPYYSVLP